MFVANYVDIWTFLFKFSTIWFKEGMIMYFKVVNGAVDLGEKRMLEEVNIEIRDKDHIAIIGRNGAGKSTLLKALIDPDLFSEGVSEEKFQVTILGNPGVGYLKQNETNHDHYTLLEEILEVYEPIIKVEEKMHKLEEKMEEGTSTLEDVDLYLELQEYYRNIGGYEYQKEYLTALNKNGFYDLDKKMSSFSGGEQTKINFIKLLLSKPDLLVLDEPTNHLDIEAILWLEDYLKNYPKTFVVVSHDRMFINQVASKIYEISYGETICYRGNYDTYEQEKKKRQEIEEKSYERQQKEIARLQRIIDRFRYKPSKASMAMSKLKQIERIVKIDKPKKEDTRTMHIKFNNILESGRTVLTVDHLQFGYTKVLGEATFTLEKGRRLGIVGENGTGKSTLLKTIMGIIPSLGGDFSFGYHVKVAYFDQQFDDLDSNLTVYEEFQKKFPEMNDFEVRSSLASFLFYDEDINKKIEVLSGGEKVRLSLCEVVFSGANFLILDEPTNHLDILSKEKLESVLKDYPGTILFVSHDRYFVKKIADSILDFSLQKITYYDYSYEDYLEKKKEQKIELDETPIKKIKVKKENKKNINIDKEICKLESRLEKLKQQLFLEEVYSNPLKYQQIEEEIKVTEEKINQLLLEWE